MSTKIMDGRNSKQQQQAVLGVLDALMPPNAPATFRKLFPFRQVLNNVSQRLCCCDTSRAVSSQQGTCQWSLHCSNSTIAQRWQASCCQLDRCFSLPAAHICPQKLHDPAPYNGKSAECCLRTCACMSSWMSCVTQIGWCSH